MYVMLIVDIMAITQKHERCDRRHNIFDVELGTTTYLLILNQVQP